MPTLIRLLIVLLVLAALVLAAMIALAVLVDPGEKQITVRVPARELGNVQTSDPLGIRRPPATSPFTSAPASAPPSPAIDTVPTDGGSIQTIELPPE